MTDSYQERFNDILGAEVEKRITQQWAEWFQSQESREPSDWWWSIHQATDALYKTTPDVLPNRDSVDPAGDRERYEDVLIGIAALAIGAVQSSRRHALRPSDGKPKKRDTLEG